MKQAIHKTWKVIIIWCLILTQFASGVSPAGAAALDQVDPFAATDVRVSGQAAAQSTVGLITKETYIETTSDATGRFSFELTDRVGPFVRLVTTASNGEAREQFFAASVGQLEPPLYLGHNGSDAYFYSHQTNVSVLVGGSVYDGTGFVRVPVRQGEVYKAYTSYSGLTSPTVEFDLSKPSAYPFELFEAPTERAWLYGRSLPGVEVRLVFLEDGNTQPLSVAPIAQTRVQADGVFQFAFAESAFLPYVGKSGRYVFTVEGIIQDEHTFTYEQTVPATLPLVLPVDKWNGKLSGWRASGDAVSYRTDLSSIRNSCYGEHPNTFTCGIDNVHGRAPSMIYLAVGSNEFEIPIESFLFDVDEPKARDRVVTGKTTPHAYVRVNDGSDFIGERADADGNFAVAVPPLAHNAQVTVEAIVGAPYLSMQTKTFTLIDERPLPAPTYQLTDTGLKVTLSRQKTTRPDGTLLLERKDGTFQRFTMTRAESGNEAFVYTLPGVTFVEGDRFTVDIADETGARVSLSDTVIGKTATFEPLTNADTVINGKTGPGLTVSTDYGQSVTSAADGSFSLPFQPMSDAMTITVTNASGTQRYSHTVQVKDVLPPALVSVKRTNWSTLLLSMSESISALTYRTFDAAGELIQEQAVTPSTWRQEYETVRLNDFEFVRSVEVVATDNNGNAATIKADVPRIGGDVVHRGDAYEGGRTLLFGSVQLGDVIVVERAGKRSEHLVESHEKIVDIDLEAPLQAGETIEYRLKGSDDVKTMTVMERSFDWVKNGREVQALFPNRPFAVIDETIELWVKDETGKETKVAASPVANQYVLSSISSHPYNSTQQYVLRVKDEYGRVTYETTKRFEEQRLPVKWDDYVHHLKLNVGNGTTLEARLGDELMVTAKANAAGVIDVPLPAHLLIGQSWRFTLIDSSGVRSSYEVPVEAVIHQFIKQLDVPTLSTQDLQGVVKPGVGVIVRSNKGQVTVSPNSKGEFKVPANQLGTGTVELRVMDSSKGTSRAMILPRIVTLDRIATKGDLRTKGKVVPSMPGGEVTLVAGDETYEQEVAADGTFNIAHEPLPLDPVELRVTNAQGDVFRLNKPAMLDRFDGLAVATFTTSSTALYGLAPAGTFVQAVVNGSIVSTATASAASRVVLNMPRQPLGTPVELRYWKTGYRGAKQTIQTIGFLPVMSVRPTTYRSDVVRGTGTIDATVTAYVGTKAIGEPTRVGKDGTFYVAIPPQPANTVITLVEEKAGYVTRTQTVRVLDLIQVMTVSPIRSTQTVAYGMGQPGATVQAYVGSKAISTPVRVSSFSTYRLTIPRLQAGTTVTIKMTHPDYLERKLSVKVVR